MKTIEKAAFDRYMSDLALPEHKRINPSNYIDWANFGANEAKRWIPVEEELPKKSCTVLVCTNLHTVGTTWFSFTHRWHQLDKRAIVTHWMPLPEPV